MHEALRFNLLTSVRHDLKFDEVRSRAGGLDVLQDLLALDLELVPVHLLDGRHPDLLEDPSGKVAGGERDRSLVPGLLGNLQISDCHNSQRHEDFLLQLLSECLSACT